MEIKENLSGGNLTLTLLGELDEYSADYVRSYSDNAFRNNSYNTVTFDMSGLTFMDSTGIGVLLGRYKLLKRLGVPVYIANCSKHVDAILSMSGIYNIIKKIS